MSVPLTIGSATLSERLVKSSRHFSDSMNIVRGLLLIASGAILLTLPDQLCFMVSNPFKGVIGSNHPSLASEQLLDYCGHHPTN